MSYTDIPFLKLSFETMSFVQACTYIHRGFGLLLSFIFTIVSNKVFVLCIYIFFFIQVK